METTIEDRLKMSSAMLYLLKTVEGLKHGAARLAALSEFTFDAVQNGCSPADLLAAQTAIKQATDWEKAFSIAQKFALKHKKLEAQATVREQREVRYAEAAEDGDEQFDDAAPQEGDDCDN